MVAGSLQVTNPHMPFLPILVALFVHFRIVTSFTSFGLTTSALHDTHCSNQSCDVGKAVCNDWRLKQCPQMHLNLRNKPGLKMYRVESTDVCQNVGSKSQKNICILLLLILLFLTFRVHSLTWTWVENESVVGPSDLTHRWHSFWLNTQWTGKQEPHLKISVQHTVH